jgi:hypothetical protein
MRAFNRRIAVTSAGQATSLGKRVIAMPDSIDEKMAAQVEATIKLAEGILVSVNEDAYDAILKAVGTLAQVIFITARDEDREDVIEEATDKLRNYLGLLDELKGMGALVARPTLTVVK